MIRMHITCDDLMRLTVAPQADALCEAIFSLDVLHQRDDEPLYGDWRRKTISGLLSHASRNGDLRSLLDGPAGEVVRGWVKSRAGSIVNRVLSTCHPDTSFHQTCPPADRPASRLVEAFSPDAPIANALEVYWQAGVEPYWRVMQAHIQADSAYRSRVLLAGGMSRLLVTLHPAVDWRPPLLQVRSGTDEDVALDGEQSSIPVDEES
jgi:hypothetical protein